MNYLQRGIITVLFLSLPLFLGACWFITNEGFTQGQTQTDEDSIKQNQQSRAEVIRKSSLTYPGQKCSEEDKKHPCYKTCKDIYNSIEDKNDCEELTVGQIQKIKEIYSTLESAEESDLNKIQEDVFDLYLSFSIRSLDDLIDRLKKRRLNSRAENILIWLAENEEMAQIFEKADKDYKSLNRLLNVIESFDPSEVERPFSQPVKKSDTIMDIIAKQEKEDSFVLKWFMDFIQESPLCKDEVASEECFTIYCKIGSEMNKTEKDKLLDIKVFENYIGNIIEDKINISNWNPPRRKTAEDLEEAEDLTDDWVDHLCDGLI